jgi:hypothetical protein
VNIFKIIAMTKDIDGISMRNASSSDTHHLIAAHTFTKSWVYNVSSVAVLHRSKPCARCAGSHFVPNKLMRLWTLIESRWSWGATRTRLRHTPAR